MILCGLLAITAFKTVGVYAVYYLLCGSKAASVALLHEIEFSILREKLLRRKRSNEGKVEGVRYAVRRYQRCPILMQLSICMHADVMIEAEFLRVVLKSTSNWLFMVTPGSHIWSLDT